MTLDEIERNYVRWYPIDLEEISAPEIFRPAKKGIYVHIPFCKTKCAYCRYNTIPEKDLPHDTYVARYLNAVRRELDYYAQMPRFGEYVIETLYIGGGTPSFLETPELIGLINYIQDRFTFTDGAEVCFEANPTTLDPYKMQAAFDAGVNRVSVGVQSFDERILKVIERDAQREENIAAIRALKATGFENINVDVIYRIPSQTLADVLASIQTAIDLGVNHLSLYPLWVRPETRFHTRIASKDLTLPDTALEIEMLRESIRLLKANGYTQYNVFDFVDRLENRCINTLYQWQDGEWVGIGPGSTSYFDGAFYINTYHVDRYVEMIESGAPAVQIGLRLSQRDRMERTMIFGLRMFPLEKKRFYDQYGVQVEDVFGRELEILLDKQFIEMDDAHINLTFDGILNVNGISKLFYAGHRKGGLQPIGVDRQGNIILEDDL